MSTDGTAPAADGPSSAEEIAQRLPEPVEGARGPYREVIVADLPTYRLRRPGDLVAAIVAIVGVVLVVLIAMLAHETTQAVTEDVQKVIPSALSALLSAPFNVVDGVATFVMPFILVVQYLIRRSFRTVGESLLAGVAAAGITLGVDWLLTNHAPAALSEALAMRAGLDSVFTPVIATVAAILTVLGATDRSRMVRWTWNLLWFMITLQVLRGSMTLPTAFTSLLMGRALGMFMRYTSGVLGDRAYGTDLVRALRRCGLDPARVMRIVDGHPIEGVTEQQITSTEPIGYRTPEPVATDTDTGGTDGDDDADLTADSTGGTADDASNGADDASLTADDASTHGTPTAQARDVVVPLTQPEPNLRAAMAATWEFSSELPPVNEPVAESAPAAPQPPRPTAARTASTVIGEKEGENRIYAVRDADGRTWDVGVLDGDRQVIGALQATWDRLRLRGLSKRAVVSLRTTMERTALMAYAAQDAGVRTPHLLGLATERDSAILVSEHVSGTQAFGDVQTRRLTDQVLDAIWQEVGQAHQAGLAHRNLDDQAILIDTFNRVWLTGWSSGEVSAPTLARRVDLVQVLALLALRVGAERAMASATRNLTKPDLEALAPMVQPVALPERTRAAARGRKDVLGQVRNLLVAVIPAAADAPLMQLRRFAPRTVITVTLMVVVGWIVLTSFNFGEMLSYVRDANPIWLVVGFILALSTYVGSAMGLVAFSPQHLSLPRTTLVQVAASVVALITPAGVGPAALNLRYLQKNKLDTPMAIATVTLVQVSQFVTTIVLLVVLGLVTGSSSAFDSLPSGTALLVALGVVLVIGVLLLFPKVRRWALAKVMPTLRSIWPRVLWVIGQPGRLALAFGGNVLTTVGYIAAFGVTLLAFDQTVPATTITIVFLAGNAAGSAVPTPGGIGAIEFALTAGLRAAGVAAGAALATAFVFRLLTFWIRIPLGWLALRWLQKRELV